MANLGPSETLLRAALTGRITWPEFGRRYRAELFESGSLDRRNRTIKNHGQKFTLRLLRQLAKRQTITLMCHCAEEERHCHRHTLQIHPATESASTRPGKSNQMSVGDEQFIQT